MGDGVNRATLSHQHGSPTSHLMKNADFINHGLIEKNRRGNASDCHEDRMEKIGPSATKDALKQTIATAGQGGKINGGADCCGFSNPDKINVGMK